MEPVAPGIAVVPVRTPTLPPATHTNTYIVGDGALSVFDPASPYDDEQRRLAAALFPRLDRGEVVERIVLTHHHADHVGGAVDLRNRLAERGVAAPIVAHPITAALVADTIDVHESWEHGQTMTCGGCTLLAHHTPGHAPGHLVFQDPESRAVIAGDMVAGIGTIAIDPDEGDLGEYLDSLAAMRQLDASVLLPAHGPPLPQADAILSWYIAHRHQRSDQIREALDTLGEATTLELAPVVYPELPAQYHPLAALQILTHLNWLRGHGLAAPGSQAGRWRPPR